MLINNIGLFRIYETLYSAFIYCILKMHISPDDTIELTNEDIVNFRLLIANPSKDINTKFKRQFLRTCIDGIGTEYTLHDHHIVPRWLIKQQLTKLCSSTPNNKQLEDHIKQYLNDPRNGLLRESIIYEKTKKTTDEVIMYLSFMFNPNNLVFGPLGTHRVS